MAADDDPGGQGLVRFAELPVVPWRNGGGVTREVVVGGSGFDPQEFDWRVSIADVNAPGPFSPFPGIDRVIMLVEGKRMDLVIDGVEHVLGLHQLLSFDGASQVSSTLPAGPTRDLNVMTRRNRRSAAVAIMDLSETRPIAVAGCQVLVLLTGSAVVAGAGGRREELHPLDAVCPRGGHRRLVMGTGRVAFVRIEDEDKTGS
ncbi:MAG: HutD family protein [Dermatophilaceae bacterium]